MSFAFIPAKAARVPAPALADRPPAKGGPPGLHSLGTRLLLVIGLQLLAALITAGAGYKGMTTARAGLETVYRDRVVSLSLLDVVSDSYSVTIVDQAHKLRNGTADWAGSADIIGAARARADNAWTDNLTTMAGPDEQRLLDAAAAAKAPMDRFCDRLLEAIARHDRPALDRMVTAEMYPTLDPLAAALNTLIALQEKITGEELDAVVGEVGRDRLVMAICLALGILTSLAIMRFVLLGVARPLRRMTAAITALAEGRLDIIVADGDRRDEVGLAAQSVATIAGNLRHLAMDLRQLIDASRQGQLGMRADPRPHEGEYRELVEGMNTLIDGLTAPLREIADVIQRLAAGDIDVRLTGAYDGDLRALKANLNRSLETVATLFAEFGGAAAAVAKGDLTRRITGAYQGGFAEMGLDFNAAMTALRDAMRDVATGTVHIASATLETTTAANQVATQSDRQSAMLTGVSSAVEQSAATAQEISRNAELGSGLAQAAAGLAADGRAELHALLADVERIAEHNGHVTRITDRIARIADKTHMLSLNAGIEAARAGREGSGFGIVAQEIGRLAEEAAAAVHDVDALITAATGSVTAGVAAARRCAATVDRISTASADLQSTIQGIAAAVAQQSAAAHTLSTDIGALHRIGEENAAAAGQIDHAMAELSAMAEQLRVKTDLLVLA